MGNAPYTQENKMFKLRYIVKSFIHRLNCLASITRHIGIRPTLCIISRPTFTSSNQLLKVNYVDSRVRKPFEAESRLNSV
jgi:hypothetical protein